MIGLKNSYSISLLIFTSLSFNPISFNSIKSFSNFKRLFLPLQIGSFAWFLSIFSQKFCFYRLDFPSLYIKKNSKFLKNKNQTISSDFRRLIKILI